MALELRTHELGVDVAPSVVRRATRDGYVLYGKRLLDVALAAVGLLASAPIWLAIAVAIRLDSPGPVIFAQERVGMEGRKFRFYKFRSMYADAEDRLAEVLALNEVDGPVFKIRRDPRITGVGRWLRRTSLDELPQLVNVLLGDMSIVGPRPPLEREVVLYRPSDLIRLSVKPGITCLWQINGRSDCSFDKWMDYDREYIRGLSAWFDLKIILGTVFVVLRGRGAY